MIINTSGILRYILISREVQFSWDSPKKKYMATACEYIKAFMGFLYPLFTLMNQDKLCLIYRPRNIEVSQMSILGKFAWFKWKLHDMLFVNRSRVVSEFYCFYL